MNRMLPWLVLVSVGSGLVPTAEAAYVEVTPGAGGTSASTHDGNVPANVVDGSLATRWSANGDGQWLQMDLGATRTVGHVRAAFYQGNTRQARFDIQAFAAGTWTTVFTGSSSGSTTALETFDFPDVDTERLRYLGHGNTTNAWNSVTEIEVFALDGGGEITPTPTPTSTPGPTATPTATPSGTTFTVGSISELQSRINAAVAGHRIVLRNGTYSTSGAIGVSGRNGTAASPIVIQAESTGGVTIGGSAGFSFSNASFVTVQGFRFTHGSTQGLAGNSHHLRFTRNVFQLGSGATHWMSVSGNDDEIDHNTFQNKTTQGVYLTVRGPGGTAMAQRTWIHHNYFLNHGFTGDNGGEGIQVGLSGLSLTAANTLIEQNLFERHNGDPEAISIKSTSNTVRYNTVRNSKGCIVLRHGNGSTVAGNFVLDSDCGIRFYGNDHRIYDNYVSGVRTTPPLSTGWGAALTIGSGSVQDHLPSHSSEQRKGQDAAERVRVSFNTFVNNTRHIGGENRAFVPRDCVIANNLLLGDSGTFAVLSSDPPVGFLWEGNLLWGAAATGNIPSSGFRRVDPQLISSSGVRRLSSGSPAVDTAAGSYPEVTVDMDGHARSGAKDVGADELSSEPVLRRPLTASDVGPSAP
jgi:parallel beta-helix repeat protein